MKALLIIFLLPSVASAFFTGMPYKNSDACLDIKADFTTATAQAKFNKAHKAYADWRRDSDIFSGATRHKLSYRDLVNNTKKVDSSGMSKVMADIAKAFSDALEHYCFRQTGKDETAPCGTGWNNNCFANTKDCIDDIKGITKTIVKSAGRFSYLCATCAIRQTATKWSNANSHIETAFDDMKSSCRIPDPVTI